MQAIGQYCNQLQSLNLGWCENVSDVGVMSLAYGCPDLRTLDLCGCVLITGISFKILVVQICCYCHLVVVFIFLWLKSTCLVIHYDKFHFHINTYLLDLI